ncbi:MarR family winged helix-turn-helix transcriptional regulator [Flexithrix dorotheae]|uniref:MarR family winged helix-turn-helix transcriptional regulator n=1 Tax=Flexithrix dorotheae TaxID=70993 RepID=UPI0004774E93|nr:MarR family transcriptional regulator [Flexithrix dorotheae]
MKEYKKFGFFIERTMKKIRQNLQRKLNEIDAGITVDQWVILDELQQKNGLSQNEIADSTFKDAPTVTRIIDLLCKKGLTERVMDENDRRRFKILLTQEGKSKVNEVLPVVMEVRKQGWNGLGEEDHQNLIRILDTIFENYK